MGLESVELAISTEEAFGITFADVETERIRTPGQLIDLVMKKVDSVRRSREQVAAKVRELVVGTLGCEQQYREDADFVKDLGMG